MFLKIESHGTISIVLYTCQKLVAKEIHILNKILVTLSNRLLRNKNKEVNTSKSPEIYSYLELKNNLICSEIYQNYWKGDTKIQFCSTSTVLGSRSILDLKVNRLPIYSKEELFEFRELGPRRLENNWRSYSIWKLVLIWNILILQDEPFKRNRKQ